MSALEEILAAIKHLDSHFHASGNLPDGDGEVADSESELADRLIAEEDTRRFSRAVGELDRLARIAHPEFFGIHETSPSVEDPAAATAGIPAPTVGETPDTSAGSSSLPTVRDSAEADA